jgi:hypothetical protein
LRGARLLSLHHVGLEWADRLATQGIRRNPVVAFVAPPLHKPGFIALVLRSDFMHAKYRKLTVEHALKFSKGTETTLVTLNEPYTPTVQAISLSYSAESGRVNVASSSVEDFTDPDLQFYHVGCFGQMRDHGYQRGQFPFVVSKDVPLLPAYENEGELMIGLRDLASNDSVSVLFQVSDGSADPDLERVVVAQRRDTEAADHDAPASDSLADGIHLRGVVGERRQPGVAVVGGPRRRVIGDQFAQVLGVHRAPIVGAASFMSQTTAGKL